MGEMMGGMNILQAGLKTAGGVMAGLGHTRALRQQADDETKLALDARINQVDALTQGEADAGRYRQRAGGVVARQRLLFANSGVDATVGTPVQVAAGTTLFGELDALTARNNARRKAMGYAEASKQHLVSADRLKQQAYDSEIATGMTMLSNWIGGTMGGGG
jgi:hypothetical protein